MSLRVWAVSLSSGYFCMWLLPFAGSTLSPRAEMVYRCHAPPAQVPLLSNSSFDLMTRSAFIARAPAEPERSLIHPGARENGGNRPAVAIRRETKDDNHPGLAAGTQGEGGVSCGAKPSADMETSTSARRRGSTEFRL